MCATVGCWALHIEGTHWLCICFANLLWISGLYHSCQHCPRQGQPFSAQTTLRHQRTLRDRAYLLLLGVQTCWTSHKKIKSTENEGQQHSFFLSSKLISWQHMPYPSNCVCPITSNPVDSVPFQVPPSECGQLQCIMFVFWWAHQFTEFGFARIQHKQPIQAYTNP